jgi:hypothetical protein
VGFSSLVLALRVRRRDAFATAGGTPALLFQRLVLYVGRVELARSAGIVLGRGGKRSPQ